MEYHNKNDIDRKRKEHDFRNQCGTILKLGIVLIIGLIAIAVFNKLGF